MKKVRKKSILKKVVSWLVSYIRDSWKVKITSLLLGCLIIYMAKNTPNLNVVEEFGYFCITVGVIISFLFLKDRAFIGDDMEEP